MNNGRLLILSKGVSYLGTKLFAFSMTWYILDVTSSGLSFSLSLLVHYLPLMAMSFAAGFLKRLHKDPRAALVLCDLLSAGVCLIPLFNLSVHSIYLTIFCLSGISAVFNNVLDSSAPMLSGVEGADDIKKLSSSLQLIISSVNLIAPALGGALFKWLPIQAFAAINIIAFASSALGETRLLYEGKGRGVGEKSPIKGASFRDIFVLRDFKVLLFGDAVANFFACAGMSVAVPVILKQLFGVSSFAFGLVMSALAAGSIAASAKNMRCPCKSSFAYPAGEVGTIGMNMLLIAALAWVRPTDTALVVAAFCAIQFVSGWLMASVNIRVLTAVQVFICDEHRGKAHGVMTGFSYILMPISLIFAGRVSETVPPFALPAFCGISLTLSMVALRLLGQAREGANHSREDGLYGSNPQVKR